MSHGSNSNCGEPGRCFNDFCEGYLLGLNDNQAKCQQNTGMCAGRAFEASGGFSPDSLDILAGGFCEKPDNALGGDFFANQPEDPMVALPDRLVSAHAQHALDGDLFYQQPEGSQGEPWWLQLDVTGGLSLTPEDPHQHPLLPDQGRVFPSTAGGFIGMNSRVQDLVFERQEQSDESCDLALSEAGDDHTYQEQGNWDQADAASLQMLQQAYLASQPQPPTPSPEEHPTPCGREECHICQVFSLPF